MIKKEPRRPVLFHIRRSQHLRQTPQSTPAPQVNLEKPVARGIETLYEERVVNILGINVRHSPAVHQNLGGLFQSRHLHSDRFVFRAARPGRKNEKQDCNDGEELARSNYDGNHDKSNDT